MLRASQLNLTPSYMKKIIYTIAVVLTIPNFFYSCSNEPVKVIAKEKDSIQESQLIIGDPIGYSYDSLSIFPVGLSSYSPNEIPKPYEGTSNFGTLSSGTYTINVGLAASNCTNSYATDISTYTNDNTDNVDIRNLIFYNRFTGKSYKLTDKKLHVIAFSIHNEFKKPIIMFHVVKNDFNKDKKFDYKDPAMLYIADLDGKNFTQLSPEDEQYIDYFFYKESNKILLKVKTDTDTNKTFDTYDQSIYREVSLEKPSVGTVLFGEKMIDDLKKLL